MRYIFLLTVCLSLLIGCSNYEQVKEIAFIGQMTPDEEQHYHLYSFWSAIPPEDWEENETDDQLRRQFDLYSSFNVPVGKLHLISYPSPESNEFDEYVEVLGIQNFPTFVILDHEGIVLKTTDVNELLEFIDGLPFIDHEE
ncbi:hypothetical protein [Alkalihalobacterium elongatum]|uniref:hypothetical protein n=1 Tax=Alkalihalobacterium elongatum TaxID=2675466 RepID=UPI001C1F7803|nr:hypothetical protein [Alkalihalobacterium elongatum]